MIWLNVSDGFGGHPFFVPIPNPFTINLALLAFPGVPLLVIIHFVT
jgi:hypothetical protein